jgi:hypothetical protein
VRATPIIALAAAVEIAAWHVRISQVQPVEVEAREACAQAARQAKYVLPRLECVWPTAAPTRALVTQDCPCVPTEASVRRVSVVA